MAKKLAAIVDALNNLGEAVEAVNTSSTTMRQQFGWNYPNLTMEQVASLAYNVRDRIDAIDSRLLSDEYDPAPLAKQITEDAAALCSHFWNGNGSDAFRAYTALLMYIDLDFAELYTHKVNWEKLAADGEMPQALARRARSLSARLNATAANVDGLDEKVQVIGAAHEAALALPTDLEALEEARLKVAVAAKAADKDTSAISAHLAEVRLLLEQIKESHDEANKLVHRTEDAYSAATTIGLGAAFEGRAKSLAQSMWVWVGGLFVALIAGGIVGWFRIELVEDLLEKNASATAVWINTLLSALSLAAPVWLAWIATKQIGQRFRLAEDYAYKASVAKAYEGYRREAVRLDPAFANQLFKSALERLDEAPLRFVEHETFGSPWHEALRIKRGSDQENEEAGDNVSRFRSRPAPTPKASVANEDGDNEQVEA